MSKKASPMLVGSFVLGAIILLIASVAIFSSSRLLQEKITFVLYFEGSVSGLSIGSSVQFRGVKIGTVSEILVRYDIDEKTVRIPVYINLGSKRIAEAKEKQNPYIVIQDLIERGMRAQLELQSLVTGQLYIELDFHPDEPINLIGEDPRYPEIPTISSSLEEWMKSFETIQWDELVANLEESLSGINKLINSPKLYEIMQSMVIALNTARDLIHSIDTQVKPVTESFLLTTKDARKMINEAKDTLLMLQDTVSPDSPIYNELNNTLNELSDAARAFRLLSDYLERHPEALIRGKK